jgi:uncharacterized protein (TIGR02118 family)
MIKIMILLKRQEPLSLEEFKSWWLGQHKELAAKMPKLRRACFDLVQGDEDILHDGVSELWFDSVADFESAYQSEIGRKVADVSLAHVSRRDRCTRIEEAALQFSQQHVDNPPFHRYDHRCPRPVQDVLEVDRIADGELPEALQRRMRDIKSAV